MKNRLDEIIKEKNINVCEMCKDIHMDRNNFYKYSRNEIVPNLRTALIISGYLNEPIANIWELE